MDITVKDILNKYPTKFSRNEISDKLWNTTIIGEKVMWDGKHHTIDDLEKPTVTQSGQGYKYTYKMGDYKITMDNFLDNFTVDVTLPNGEGHPPTRRTWTNDDEIYY